ncbi:ABC transporter [Devosia psychrophila]|uniref:ABC transporter n=1 Tax=Devosia psychrophila TaxID=728005 RepID=A0A1I1Q959_9HYPH|nr:ABC transporter [Devosia psychrophila]
MLVPAWFGHASAAPWRQRAAELLDNLGVPRNRTSTALLSRGEQQRVAIARALMFDPAVIFADEPTASLDAASGAVVIAALARLAHAEGRTVIVASHDPALLAAADLTIALEHGHPVRIVSKAAS